MFKKFLIILVFFIGLSFAGNCFAKEKAKTPTKEAQPLNGSAVININSDFMDYYEEKDQIIATGNVKIRVEAEETTLEADKVTYDRENDFIIAENNVRIINRKNVINGDYARIDLTQDSVLIDRPNTVISQIKIDAKKANIYPKKGDESKKDIDVSSGTATFNDKTLNYVLSTSGTKYITDPTIVSKVLNKNSETAYKNKYIIHSKKVLVKRDKDVDIITLLNSTITINKYRIAKIPCLTLTTNKDTNQMETNFPEMGRKPELGGYGGWGPLFNLPGGKTLKVAPIMAIDHGFGVGALSRFTSDTNRTEVAYATLKKKFVIEGEQLLPFSETTKIQYGKNSYVENGFFGRQLPEFIIEAVDNRKIASAYNFDFDLRSSAAYIQTDHRWSTGRYQLQGNIYNNVPLYKIGKYTSLGANSQFAADVYGNGDTYGVLRAGPTISVYKGPLYAWLAYYQGGIYGETPLAADRFYYGKSNVTFVTRYKINKYATIGYEASLNLSKDNWDQKLLAENQIFCWFGPDDLKFRLGYDSRRKVPTFDLNMLLGSDRSTLEFDKLKVTEN